MPEVVQFLWVGGSLSKIESLCLKSFLDHGHEVHLYIYDHVPNVPDGVRILEGCTILSADKIFTTPGVSKAPSYASFADRFRLHLLAQKGGWWFDMDFVCLKKISAPRELRFASTWEREWGECPVNSAIWSPVGSRHMERLVELCEDRISSGKNTFGELGPFLLQPYIKENSLEKNVAPWWEFCPYPWRLMKLMAPRTGLDYAKDRVRLVKHLIWEQYDPHFKAAYIRRGTLALHLHNEIWKNSNLGKNDTYFWCSPIERLKRRHGI